MARTIADLRDAVTKWGLSPRFYSWIEENFRFYRCKASEMVVTGYYLASLRASWERSEDYPYPVYRRPGDLCRVNLRQFPFFEDVQGLPAVIKGRVTEERDVHPYWTREEIDFESALSGRGEELLWVDSLVDLHSLHVQGSGVAYMNSGEEILLGYADSNGHYFRGIGAHLIENGLVPDGVRSSQEIDEFLSQRPHMWRSVFSANPSYVFFTKRKGGPVGCLNVPITAGRTIATDHRYFPPGAIALLECERPVFSSDGKLLRWKRFRRFVVNQDTGGAIKGARRLDLYFGHGSENARMAGSMKQGGVLWFMKKR